MGRAARFTREDLLLAAAAEAAMGRPVTIQALAAASGATIGSIYHRFDSREEILGEAWLLAVRSFQSAFVPAVDAAANAEQGVEAALTVPRWSRENPDLASLLTLRRQEDFLDARTPAHLRREAAAINKFAMKVVGAFAARSGRSDLQCRIALIAMPYGAVRLFLPKQKPPAEIDTMIAAAYRAVMEASPAASGNS
ncbi:TetR/AcrR family transcriptional regulator [Bradyrhizobium sp.]|uniref:TetR/AcrR family transcriptional regulator n=1 Tax=Bradyrhizobium sp. TaxID=376 RepID=UPI00271C7DA3|nr:TetR family transcriptional regulator [Bradyrhizobium sp.]MDO9295614.1 TetR family transcriptional regulator [Bradyrhizobium sp.]